MVREWIDSSLATFGRGSYYVGLSVRAWLTDRPDPWEVVDVPAAEIEWTMKAEPRHGGPDVVRFHNVRHAGLVVGGEWDRQLDVRFEDMAKYEAVRQHFEEGVPWEETGIFEALAVTIRSQGSFDGCQSVADLRERYRDIDRLYDSIVAEGYDRSTEESWPFRIWPRVGLPTVNVGRDGTLVKAQGGGYHRLSIARLLDLEVPVRIVVRHPAWEDRRGRSDRAICPTAAGDC